MRIEDIDDRDRAILRELMRDGRLTNAVIREAGAVSPAPASLVPAQENAADGAISSPLQPNTVTRLWPYRTGLREIDPPRLPQ